MIGAVVVRVKIDLQESLRLDSNFVMMRKTLILLLKPHKGEVLAANQQAPISRQTVYHHLMDLLHKDLHLLLMTTVEGEEDTNQDLVLGLGLPPEAMRGISSSVEEDGEEETGTFVVLILV